MSLMQGNTLKFSRKNTEILPFEAGGEVKLEQYTSKADCGQFVLGNHTKKRPNNLILGRLYDGRLYDLLELGIDNFRSIKSHGAASATVQSSNKVCHCHSLWTIVRGKALHSFCRAAVATNTD